MKLDLTPDQILLQDTAARLFRSESTSQRIRAAEATGFDPALWRQVVELGLVSMRAPEDRGGGSSLLDAAVVTAEAGRYLAAVPLVEAIVATALLLRHGPPEALAQAVAGGEIATLALGEAFAAQAQLVPAGAVADIILYLEGDVLYALRPTSKPAKATSLDASPVALIDLAAAEGERVTLSVGRAAREAYEAAREEWKLLTAASLAALSRQALEMAAAYSVERVQFGKPIGSFQGIAHPLADSITEVDGARLLVWRAIWAMSRGDTDAGAFSAMAFWWAGDAAGRAVQRALRTFGGYGLSLEYDVQLYFRRAKVLALLAGDSALDLERIAGRLWQGEAAALPDAGEVSVDFGFGAEAEAYAAEMRAFVEANVTPDVEKKKHHSTSGHHPGFHKALAKAGYAFPDMEAAGGTRSRYEVMAAAPLWEDMNWTRTPLAVTEFVAKMTELWSGDEAKAEIMPRFISGEALGCLGFSEPSSGSDVFAASFSAVRDGDGWVMNGQKMFTTNAHNADYILMLARTDTSGKKHQGLTMFVMPLNLPGVEIHPVHTLQDERTNIVYWSDVRIADKYRLGEVGDGARVMASALGFEHGGAGYHAAQTAMMKHAVAWARRPRGNAGPPMEDPMVRRTLARAAVNSEVAEVLCRRQIWAEVEGVQDHAFGPMAKMFTTETMYQDASAIVALAAPASLVRGQDHDLDMVEVTMRRALGMTIYGGTSEVHRSLIAENALGMPKSRS
ncbi:MAG: hypothetical protein JWQ29_666 [Phenylobacterium sp.]|nr:hypothetical protein [Phenylobacterium sp.]